MDKCAYGGREGGVATESEFNRRWLEKRMN